MAPYLAQAARALNLYLDQGFTWKAAWTLARS